MEENTNNTCIHMCISDVQFRKLAKIAMCMRIHEDISPKIIKPYKKYLTESKQNDDAYHFALYLIDLSINFYLKNINEHLDIVLPMPVNYHVSDETQSFPVSISHEKLNLLNSAKNKYTEYSCCSIDEVASILYMGIIDRIYEILQDNRIKKTGQNLTFFFVGLVIDCLFVYLFTHYVIRQINVDQSILKVACYMLGIALLGFWGKFCSSIKMIQVFHK